MGSVGFGATGQCEWSGKRHLDRSVDTSLPLAASQPLKLDPSHARSPLVVACLLGGPDTNPHRRSTRQGKALTDGSTLDPSFILPMQPQDSQAVKLVKVKSVESRTGSTGNVTQVRKEGRRVGKASPMAGMRVCKGMGGGDKLMDGLTYRSIPQLRPRRKTTPPTPPRADELNPETSR